MSLLSSLSHTSQTGAAATTGARQTSSTVGPTVLPESSSQASSGLSTGAKIGIGVAVPLVVLALIGFGLFLFFRRRKAHAGRRDELPAEVEAKPAGYHELPPKESNLQTYYEPSKTRPTQGQLLQEMDAQDYNELPGDRPVAEIGGGEMQQSSPVDGTVAGDSQYKDRSFQDHLSRPPSKKTSR